MIFCPNNPPPQKKSPDADDADANKSDNDDDEQVMTMPLLLFDTVTGELKKSARRLPLYVLRLLGFGV